MEPARIYRSCGNRWRRALPALFLALIFFSLLLASCREETEPAGQGANAFSYEKTLDKEGVEVRLQLDRQSLNVAELGRLIVTVTAPEQWSPVISPPAPEPGKLSLIEVDRQGPNLIGTARIRTKIVYDVQPFLPGEESIGPFEVRVPRPDSELEIATEQVPVNVVSLLPDKEKATLNDIAPPLAMASHWVLYFVAGGLLLALALFGWWRYSKKSKKVEALSPPPPHRKAHEALDRLVARGLLEKGEIALFFRQLSDILRCYIEERFSVQAPEQTTEEFLQAISALSYFRQTDKELLRDFLTHCDLVKFAKHEPTIMQGQDSLQLCRRFIDETAVFGADRNGTGGPP